MAETSKFKISVPFVTVALAMSFISCSRGLRIGKAPTDSTARPSSGNDGDGGDTLEKAKKRTLERMVKAGFPMGSLSADQHPAFGALTRFLEVLYPSAQAETPPANPDRKVYVQVLPSTWGDGHYMECNFKNVSPELANPGVNPIDATAPVLLAVRSESGGYKSVNNQVFPAGNYKSYERVLQPGETWALQWNVNVGPPDAPGTSANVPLQFPRGLNIVARNVDAARPGLIMGKCIHWWANGGYNHDLPVFSGLPF